MHLNIFSILRNRFANKLGTSAVTAGTSKSTSDIYHEDLVQSETSVFAARKHSSKSITTKLEKRSLSESCAHENRNKTRNDYHKKQMATEPLLCQSETMLNGNGSSRKHHFIKKLRRQGTATHTQQKQQFSDVTDVLLRMGIVALFFKLEVTSSFKRYIQIEELWMYKYPRTTDYVSAFTLLVSIIVGPFIVTFLRLCWTRNLRDFRAATWVWTGALCLNGLVTSLLKIMAGRPRPDFFYRCYPDGQIPINATLNNTNILDISTCTGSWHTINEGFKSFPSGHASFAFVGYGFLTFYIGAKLHAFSAKGRSETWRLVLAMMPLLLALVVAVSRTCDYHHHWQDVIAGGIIGFCICYYMYRQYYPSVFALDCDKPYKRDGEIRNVLLTISKLKQKLRYQKALKLRLRLRRKCLIC